MSTATTTASIVTVAAIGLVSAATAVVAVRAQSLRHSQRPPRPPRSSRPPRTPVVLVLLRVDGTTEPVRVLLRDGRLVTAPDPDPAPSPTDLPSGRITATYDLSLDPDTAERLAGALLHAVDCPDEEVP